MKNRSLENVLFVLVASAILVLCVTSAESADRNPIKIGVLTPLSQPGDPAGGGRIVWGSELAAKFINEEMGGVLGGRPIELVVEDDAGTPSEGVAGYRKLVQKDKVVAVVGQYHSSVCLAVTEASKSLGVPVFSTGASSTKITETNYPTIFSIMPSTPGRAKSWIEFIKNAGMKRVGYMGEDTDYGTNFREWVQKYAVENGLEVKSMIFPRTSIDLTPALLEMQAWKPDIVINAGAGAGAYLLVKQAYDIGLFPKVPMLASYDFPTLPEFWDAVGDGGKYILYEAYYSPLIPMSRVGKWMISRYREMHKEEPSFFPINVFGEILVIAQALDLAQSDQPKDLIKSLVDWAFIDSYGVVQFKEPAGYDWHLATPPILILQQTQVRQKLEDSKLVWPPALGGDGKFERP
jgi:branched-chain amino acid transport system substrate-binding protein